jgi:hypothetical protein
MFNQLFFLQWMNIYVKQNSSEWGKVMGTIRSEIHDFQESFPQFVDDMLFIPFYIS